MPSEQPREGTQVHLTLTRQQAEDMLCGGDHAKDGFAALRSALEPAQPEQPRGEEARVGDEWEILRSEISRYVEAAHKGDAVEPITDLILTAFMDSPARNPIDQAGMTKEKDDG